MEIPGGYKTRDRPRQDPRGAGGALINTAGQGRGDPGRGGRGARAGRRGHGGRGGQEKRIKSKDDPDKHEREFSNIKQ